MKRRHLLSSLGGVFSGLSAGCLGGGGGNNTTSGSDNEKVILLGETDERNGLSITVHGYTVVPWYARYKTIAKTGNNKSTRATPQRSTINDKYVREPPTAGGTIALMDIEVEVVGDGRAEVPSGKKARAVYNDTELKVFITEANYLYSKKQWYSNYHQLVVDSDANKGALPGAKLRGWQPIQVPKERDGWLTYFGFKWAGKETWWRFEKEPTTTTEG